MSLRISKPCGNLSVLFPFPLKGEYHSLQFENGQIVVYTNVSDDFNKSMNYVTGAKRIELGDVVEPLEHIQDLNSIDFKPAGSGECMVGGYSLRDNPNPLEQFKITVGYGKNRYIIDAV